jgi:hypothetical protein
VIDRSLAMWRDHARPPDRMHAMNLFVVIGPGGDWRPVQTALFVLGAVLADELGPTRMHPPIEDADGTELYLRASVPGPDQRLIEALLQTALVGIVEEFLEPGTDFTVGALVDEPG